MVQGTRGSSRVEVGNSVFLSSSDRNLGVPIGISVGSQTSSDVDAWNSASRLRCKRGARHRVELGLGSGAISRGATELSVLPSFCELILRMTVESVQGYQAYLDG